MQSLISKQLSVLSFKYQGHPSLLHHHEESKKETWLQDLVRPSPEGKLNPATWASKSDPPSRAGTKVSHKNLLDLKAKTRIQTFKHISRPRWHSSKPRRPPERVILAPSARPAREGSHTLVDHRTLFLYTKWKMGQTQIHCNSLHSYYRLSQLTGRVV